MTKKQKQMLKSMIKTLKIDLKNAAGDCRETANAYVDAEVAYRKIERTLELAQSKLKNG